MSAKFPRGGGAGPFLARSLNVLLCLDQQLSKLSSLYKGIHLFKRSKCIQSTIALMWYMKLIVNDRFTSHTFTTYYVVVKTFTIRGMKDELE